MSEVMICNIKQKIDGDIKANVNIQMYVNK